MEYDTSLSAEYVAGNLDKLIERAHRDSLALVDKGEIAPLVTHFAALRSEYDNLKDKLDSLEAEVKDLSYNLIPAAFDSQQVKTINIKGVGRVTVNVRWVASMVAKVRGLEWLRSTGNDGIIIETVNAQTLASFAKEKALAGEPLPEEIFTVAQANHTSITKS